MKFVSLSSFLLLFGVHICRISANTNHKIDSNYEFPDSARIKRADSYYQPSVRKQYDGQYEPSPRVAAAQTYSPSVSDSSEYSGQSYSQPASYRAGSRSRATYGNNKDEEAARLAEEEEEKKPDRLALLLQDSKFTCSDKKDGYYADESVGCQVFHYCVTGAKHSWQCPENTVFHQIHLNCVPSAQDICQQSSKYHVVNDYLYKELDQRGPNNSIRYHQRYYPEGFDFGGDTLSQVLPPSQPSQPKPQRPRTSTYDAYDSDSYSDSRGNSRSQPETYPSYQSYPAPAPAPVRAQPPTRTIYKPAVTRTAAPAYTPPAYTQPAYTTLAQTIPTTRRPVTYSTPNAYPSSYSDSSDSDYSSGSSYSLPRDSEYASSVPTYSAPSSGYSAPSSSYSAPSSGYSAPSSSYSVPSSGYSAPSSSYSAPSTSNSASSYASNSAFSPSLSSSSYPSSSSVSSAGASSYVSYKPTTATVSVRPAAYPSRPIGIPIASFRVASSPAYGSSAQASRIRSAAYPMSSSFSLGAFNSELAGGVKYDEEY
jgi:hypothetical protein